MRRHLPVLICIFALFAITFAAFAQVLNADFVQWDDDAQLYLNPKLGGLSLHNLAWACTDFDATLRYVPLTLIGWMITYQCCGLNPFGYHLGNLLLHASSVVVVFLVMRRLLRAGFNHSMERSGNAFIIPSALAALLWGLHPLRVEPVAWCTTRSYCQGVFFLLLSVLAYLFAAQTSSPAGRRNWYLCSVATYAASLLSYPVGLGFFAAFVILDVYPLRRLNPSKRLLRDVSNRQCMLEKTPFLILALISFALTVAARFHESQVYMGAATLSEFGVLPRIMQAFYIWAYYLWRPWYPFDLSPVYTTLLGFEPLDQKFVLSLVAVMMITVVLFINRWRWPMALALWLFHLAVLVPMLGLTEHPHYSTDRYSLVVSLTWSVLLAAGLAKLWITTARRTLAITATLAALLLISGLTVLTVRQVRVWHNSQTLFTHMIQTLGEDTYRAHIHRRLAVYHLREEAWHEAERAAAEATRINPSDVVALTVLADSLRAQGRVDESIAAMARVMSLKPDEEQTCLNLASLLAAKGQHNQAIEYLLQGLRFHAGSPELHFELGVIYERAAPPRPRQAAAEYETVLRLRPDHLQAREHLQRTREQIRKNEEGS